jgi:alanine racemase
LWKYFGKEVCIVLDAGMARMGLKPDQNEAYAMR